MAPDEPPSTSSAAPKSDAPATTTKKAPGKPKAKKAKKVKQTREEREADARLTRGGKGLGIKVRSLKDRKLKGRLHHVEDVVRAAQAKAVKVGQWLLPSEGGVLEAEGIERTYNFKQEDIVKHVDVGAAQKAFDLKLPDLGPYQLDFTRNGRYMLLGGRRGHLALMDWSQSHLVCEVQVAETTRDVCFLHNELFFAAAQKKYCYLYDKRGYEVHCLKAHTEVQRLQFLPHHFLLASVGDAGVLRYQDTSHGEIVAQHRTKLGPCSVMRQNPYNAVLCLGHTKGSVTMWTPNITTPVVKMLCHRGPISSLAVDISGQYMVTAGVDNHIKVWDIRMMQPLHSYFSYSPATSLDISQRGLLAVGYGRKVQVWRDALRTKQHAPYMSHTCMDGVLETSRFCPYEDVMGLGHSGGVSTILVPGAGEPNFDSFVANPFQNRRERQEQEVHQLLDKLQPETIMMDPDAIGRVRKEPQEVQKERRELETQANKVRRKEAHVKNDSKTRMMGKNRPSKRHRKKQGNVIEEKRADVVKQMHEQEKRKKDKEQRIKEQQAAAQDVPRALSRFYAK